MAYHDFDVHSRLTPSFRYNRSSNYDYRYSISFKKNFTSLIDINILRHLNERVRDNVWNNVAVFVYDRHRMMSKNVTDRQLSDAFSMVSGL